MGKVTFTDEASPDDPIYEEAMLTIGYKFLVPCTPQSKSGKVAEAYKRSVGGEAGNLNSE